MNTTIQEKPTSVKVIGWGAIIIASMMIMSGILGTLMFSFMMSQAGENPFESGTFDNVPEGFRPFMVMFQHFQFFGIIQAVIGILLLTSGIQFLRLKNWARTILEGYSWFALVGIVVFTGLWIYMWFSITSEISQTQGNQIPPAFRWMGPIIAAFVDGIHIAISIIVIRALRSTKVRNAMMPA